MYTFVNWVLWCGRFCIINTAVTIIGGRVYYYLKAVISKKKKFTLPRLHSLRVAQYYAMSISLNISYVLPLTSRDIIQSYTYYKDIRVKNHKNKPKIQIKYDGYIV